MDPAPVVALRSKKYVYIYKYYMTIAVVSNDAVYHVPPTTAKTVPHHEEELQSMLIRQECPGETHRSCAPENQMLGRCMTILRGRRAQHDLKNAYGLTDRAGSP